MTFIVFALPRSRTAWTREYLRYPISGNWRVGHDIAATCSTPNDFFNKFDGEMIGAVETAAMLGWRLIRERMPEAKFAVIRRPVSEVERSLSQFGIEAKMGELIARASMLNEISGHPGVLTVQFDDLCQARTRAVLFEHCLQIPWDEAWDREMAWRNVQIDVHARMKYLADNQARIEGLKAQLLA
jgi:hypothetical protein